MGTPNFRKYAGEPIFGKYRGIVVKRDDPHNRNRIIALVPRIGRTFITDWALPCGVHPNDYNVPKVGDNVYIEFEGGMPEFPIWSYASPRQDQVNKTAVNFKVRDTIGGRRVIGNELSGEIILDSTPGEESIVLQIETLDYESERTKLSIYKSQKGIEASSQGDILLTSIGSCIINSDGTVDIQAFSDLLISAGGNGDMTFAGELQIAAGKSAVVVANEDFITSAGETIELRKVNELFQSLAALILEQTGEIKIRVGPASETDSSVIQIKSAANNYEINIESQGKVNIQSKTGKVVLQGIGANPLPIGVLTGHTIDRFTGTPFGPGAPGGSSISVEATG